MIKERRITGTVGTIPDFTTLAGVVTTSPTDNTRLLYTGSNDIGALVTAAGVSITDGIWWLYVPGLTPFISRIIGIYQVGNNSWALTLKTGIAGAADSPCNVVKGNLTGYSYQNDGSASGTVNLVTVKENEGDKQVQLAPEGNRAIVLPVVYVDATGTDFFIVETS